MTPLARAARRLYVSAMFRGVLYRLAPATTLLLVAVLLAPPVVPPAAAQIKLQSFARDRLTIVTAAGERHRFEVELAVNRAQHAQGLMFRRRLPEQAGMLFLYRGEGPVSMWMRNTYIPLDMLFIARGGEIVRIVERTVPHSLEAISSEAPVVGVLEVNGGTAARLGIRPGDRVLHSALQRAP